jgi:hypothetical protein
MWFGDADTLPKDVPRTHIHRFYWLMHDRLIITIMALIAIDSIASDFSVAGIAGGVMVIATTIASYPHHLLHAFAVLVLACPIVVATSVRITPWAATLALAADLAGGRYVRLAKQPVRDKHARNDAADLETVLVDARKDTVNSKKAMMF